jgi:hypothetical protein
MKINRVTIKNVKGFADKTFDLDLVPNKPNLLVAPNGFGKSSIAVAFDSMNSKHMTLDEADCYQGDAANAPELSLELVLDDGTPLTVQVDNGGNTLAKHLDVSVIRSALMPKATMIKFGGFAQARSSLEVKSVVLDRIVGKAEFAYSYSNQKAAFGANGKVLPNITELLKRPATCRQLNNHNFGPYGGKKIQAAITTCIAAANGQIGNADQLRAWIQANLLAQLQAIPPLKDLAEQLRALDNSGLQTEAEVFLAAIQIVELHKADAKPFRAAIEYTLYVAQREWYEQLLSDLYGGWAKVEVEEDKKKGRLVIRFPKANQFSNGQRDFLSLVFAFEKARQELQSQHCMLVVDEIFDYLDDANLVAFQYFLTSLITSFKAQKRELFPVLLTHLDPALFHHFCFNGHKIKVHYLDVGSSGKSGDTIAMIAARDAIPNAGIVLDADYFHFNPAPTSHVGQFAAMKLRLEWENPAVFRQYVEGELQRYLGRQNFDPMAICFAVRILVEQAVYKQLVDPSHQAAFLAEHGTTKKLEYASSAGIDVPETFFLLGLIYNDGLHWKTGRDVVSPMSTKLRHPIIKHLVSRVPQ